MVLFRTEQGVKQMTTEEFEKELRKLQKAGHIEETQIQEALRMHRLHKAGKVSVKKFNTESSKQ